MCQKGHPGSFVEVRIRNFPWSPESKLSTRRKFGRCPSIWRVGIEWYDKHSKTVWECGSEDYERRFCKWLEDCLIDGDRKVSALLLQTSLGPPLAYHYWAGTHPWLVDLASSGPGSTWHSNLRTCSCTKVMNTVTALQCRPSDSQRLGIDRSIPW